MYTNWKSHRLVYRLEVAETATGTWRARTAIQCLLEFFAPGDDQDDQFALKQKQKPTDKDLSGETCLLLRMVSANDDI